MAVIATVFPRRTKATPKREMAFVGDPGLFVPAGIDKVYISVAFTWDLKEAERLAKAWRHIAPVEIGGPATGMRGGEFVPGQHLKPGYVITSRGCPNRCWFCEVWKREGDIKELPITEGWNVLDDNLLACSEQHIFKVFEMLSKQKRRPEFTGGLEAKRLTLKIAEALRSLRPEQVFFAYDEPADWEPLADAVSLMWRVGFPRKKHCIRCYVLCGYPKDSIERAAERMRQVISIGVTPMAMLWRDRDGKKDPDWGVFQRSWARPAMIHGSEGLKRIIRNRFQFTCSS